MSDGERLRIVFELPAASYVLQIGDSKPRAGMSKEVASQKYTISVGALSRLAPSLPLHAGSSVSVLLDPISRTAVRQFVVERRSLVAFSLVGTPVPDKLKMPVSVGVRNAEGEDISPAEASDFDDRHRHASYILAPGTYFVEAEARANEWPSPILEGSLRSAQIGLQVDSVLPYQIPKSMEAMSAWLNEIGLGDLMEFSEVADLREPSRNLPGADKRLLPYALSVGLDRSKVEGRSSATKSPLESVGGTIQWPVKVKERDQPVMVILFRVKKDRAAFRATEVAFNRAYGTALWNRVLQKVSALEGVSARKIVMVVPVWCDPDLVYLDDNREAYRHGWTCDSASMSAPLGIPANVGAAASYSPATLHPNLAETVPKISAVVSQTYASWREIKEIKTVPCVPCSHPFVERLIGTIRREYLDQVPFWNAIDLTRKLDEFRTYYNAHRVHRSLAATPSQRCCEPPPTRAALDRYAWSRCCRGLFHTDGRLTTNSPRTRLTFTQPWAQTL